MEDTKDVKSDEQNTGLLLTELTVRLTALETVLVEAGLITPEKLQGAQIVLLHKLQELFLAKNEIKD